MKTAALNILEKLRQSGFEAYFAGGSVRDMLLGKPAKDYDIATAATPDQIEALFSKTRSIGKHFGVILVEEQGHHIEVATFRADSDYSDGRRPNGVTFTTAQEDVKRRDFTINGLLYDPIADKVLDFVDGQIDLKEHLIRFIGNPADRIQEDSLRILRAIRFKNRLGFRYHPDTFAALRQYSHLVTRVSSERIRDELNFLLLDASRSDSIRDLHEFGLLQILLPEIEKLRGVTQPFEYHTEGDAFEHTLHALESIGKTTNLTLVWATLLHDSGKAETFALKERIRFDSHAQHSAVIAKAILTRLHFPNRFITDIMYLVSHHMMWVSLRDMPDNRKRKWIFDEHFPDLQALFLADACGSKPLDLSLYHEIENIVTMIKTKYQAQPAALLSAEELMTQLHLKPGPKLGKILSTVYEAQLDHQVSSKTEALAMAKDLLTSD